MQDRPPTGIRVSFRKRNQNRKHLLSFLLYTFLHCFGFYKIDYYFHNFKDFT